MREYFPNKKKSLIGFLSVYSIVKSNVSNVLYKLHYIGGVLITLKVRHCPSNHISSFDNLDVRFMLPPTVRINDPVRLKFNSIINDVMVLLGLFHNLNREQFLAYNKEVY